MRIGGPRLRPVAPSSPQPTRARSAAPEKAKVAADAFEPAPVSSSRRVTTTPAASAVVSAPAPAPAKQQSFWAKVGDALGGAARTVGAAIDRVATGAANAVVGAFKNLGEAAATFGGGLKDLFTGHFGEGFKKLGLSLLKVVQTPADALLMAGGAALSAVQMLLGVEPPGRKLTPDEMSALRQVYGDSIDYDRVRIKEGDAGLLTLSGRAFVHGDTLYIPKDSLPLSKTLLVHESAHVWQHQNGGTDYMSEALFAQAFGDAYDYGKALVEGRSWAQMDPEQQAALIQKAYEQNLFGDPNATFFVDGRDFTKEVRAAIAEMRAGRGAP